MYSIALIIILTLLLVSIIWIARKLIEYKTAKVPVHIKDDIVKTLQLEATGVCKGAWYWTMSALA